MYFYDRITSYVKNCFHVSPLGIPKTTLNTPRIKTIYEQYFDDNKSFTSSCASLTLIVQHATSKSARGLI